MDNLPTLTPAEIANLTDEELLEAYSATSQEVGDPEVERLIPEMQRRDLDF